MRLPILFRWAVLGIVIALSLTRSSYCDERLKDIACRSVHLAYPAPEAVMFYNEVTVRKSADGTYFCVCGCNKGYFGIQELANGNRLIIFSVWDPGEQNNPNAVADDLRVQMHYKDEAVRTGRFGNEGTGGQSFYDYRWKDGQTYRFMVMAQRDGENRTAFTAFFFHPEENEWKRLVTFSTITEGKLLGGYYSFVEDFRRNRVSTTKTRQATFGNGWVMTAEGTWHPLNRARFTADRNPVMNIDASKSEPVTFDLLTGGEIENNGTPLWQTMEHEAPAAPPESLKEFVEGMIGPVPEAN